MVPKDFTEIVQAFLSAAVVLSFLYLAITTGEFKDALIAGFSGVLGYWIGSSQGSKAKTQNLMEGSK